MTVFEAMLLGLLQGISEFLPISSSGHLVLFQEILGINEGSKTFDIMLHLGTLIPIFIVFWEDISAILKKPFQKLTYMLILATIPTVIAALLFDDLIDSLFDNIKFLPYCFIITGIFLLYADSVKDTKKQEKDMTPVDALVIGVMQAIAITPAISRSGSTITGALFRRLNREYAAKFAFLMSIPAVLGAAVLEVKDFFTGEAVLDNILSAPYLMGILVAALSGYLAVRFMLKLIKNSKLKYFAYYVFVLATFILLDQWIFHLYF